MAEDRGGVIDVLAGVGVTPPDASIEVEADEGFDPYDGDVPQAVPVVNFVRATEKLGYGRGLKAFGLWRLLVTKGEPEKVFFPSMQSRLKDLNLESFNKEKANKAIEENKPAPKELTKKAITDAIAEINSIMRDENNDSAAKRANAVIDYLKTNALLAEFLNNAMRSQYGRGALSMRDNWGWYDTYGISFAAIAQAIEAGGEHFIFESLQTLKAADFYGSMSLEEDPKDKRNFKLVLKDDDDPSAPPKTLMICRHDPKTNKTIFDIDPSVKPEDMDRALLARADFIASHRQSRNDNTATMEFDSNGLRFLRQAEILLWGHHMHIHISAEVINKMDEIFNKSAYSDEIRDRWQLLKHTRNTFDPNDSGKFFAKLTDIPKIGDYEELKLTKDNKYYEGETTVIASNKKNFAAVDAWAKKNIFDKHVYGTKAAPTRPHSPSI